MTTYNITKYMNYKHLFLMYAMKKYLNVEKIQVFYNDWINEFGIRCYNTNIDKNKKFIALKKVYELCKDIPINVFQTYPKVISK